MVTMFIKRDKNIITKNTIENVQASAIVTPVERSIFSYNKVTKTGALQSTVLYFKGHEILLQIQKYIITMYIILQS